jgi:hypothetical protein
MKNINIISFPHKSYVIDTAMSICFLSIFVISLVCKIMTTLLVQTHTPAIKIVLINDHDLERMTCCRGHTLTYTGVSSSQQNHCIIQCDLNLECGTLDQGHNTSVTFRFHR